MLTSQNTLKMRGFPAQVGGTGGTAGWQPALPSLCQGSAAELHPLPGLREVCVLGSGRGHPGVGLMPPPARPAQPLAAPSAPALWQLGSSSGQRERRRFFAQGPPERLLKVGPVHLSPHGQGPWESPETTKPGPASLKCPSPACRSRWLVGTTPGPGIITQPERPAAPSRGSRLPCSFHAKPSAAASQRGGLAVDKPGQRAWGLGRGPAVLGEHRLTASWAVAPKVTWLRESNKAGKKPSNTSWHPEGQAPWGRAWTGEGTKGACRGRASQPFLASACGCTSVSGLAACCVERVCLRTWATPGGRGGAQAWLQAHPDSWSPGPGQRALRFVI